MSELSTCVLCPRLCRTSCPVATGSAREAATPSAIASVLWDYEQGRVTRSLAIAAATLCVDCGACQDRCHLDRPLPEILRKFRAELLPESLPDEISAVEGEGRYVAVLTDDRDWSGALARATGEAVRVWRTGDHLGLGATDRISHARRLRDGLPAGCVVVTADGGVALSLRNAGIDYLLLGQLVPAVNEGVGSCVIDGEKPLACCGAAGPLAGHHPEDANRVGRAFHVRSGTNAFRDSRCASHLRNSGCDARDPVDRLLALHAR